MALMHTILSNSLSAPRAYEAGWAARVTFGPIPPLGIYLLIGCILKQGSAWRPLQTWHARTREISNGVRKILRALKHTIGTLLLRTVKRLTAKARVNRWKERKPILARISGEQRKNAKDTFVSLLHACYCAPFLLPFFFLLLPLLSLFSRYSLPQFLLRKCQHFSTLLSKCFWPPGKKKDKRVEKMKRNATSQQLWHMMAWSKGL